MAQQTQHRYKIIPEYNLIIDSWKGNISYSEIIYFKIKQASDPDWKPHYNTLSDMRDSIIVHTKKEIEDYETYKSRGLKIEHKRKTAALTNDPNQVVFNLMLKEKITRNVPISLEIFSTLKAALYWLGINLEKENEIANILEELSH